MPSHGVDSIVIVVQLLELLYNFVFFKTLLLFKQYIYLQIWNILAYKAYKSNLIVRAEYLVFTYVLY